MSEEPIYPHPCDDGYRRAVMRKYPGVPDPGIAMGCPPLKPEPNAPAQPLTVFDRAFRTPDGRAWKYRAVTAFNAMSLALADKWDQLEAYAAWSQSLGATAWRVFGTWYNTRLKPTEHGDRYYDVLDRLLTFTTERGLVLHFDVFCDQIPEGENDYRAGVVTMSPAEQDRHLYRVIEVLHGRAALGAVGNEDFKNGRITARFPASIFTGVPWTRSAAADNEWPDVPGSILDYTTSHTPRDDEWPRKAKELVDFSRLGFGPIEDKNSPYFGWKWQPTLKPAIAGEPIRMDKATPSDYADYMATAELFGGACLHGGAHAIDANHSTNLQFCEAPEPGSHGDQVAQAVADVWRSGIDPELSAIGTYTRGPFDNCPLVHSDATALRTFAMMAGSRAVAVVVRPTTEHQVTTQDGWRVVRRVRNVLWLER